MKKVSAQKEAEILKNLQADIANDPENADELNSSAISQIYQSEKCTQCGDAVGMLSDKGLCGCCEYKNSNEVK